MDEDMDDFLLPPMEDGPDVEHFDITLAASHSYMGDSMVPVSGRSLLEPGWTGEVPALAHVGVVFPGETVPMLMSHAGDAAILNDTIKKDKMFGLLCPDETNTKLSGYGVLCEIFETGTTSASDEDFPIEPSFTFKAKAVYRIRMKRMPKDAPIHLYIRPQKISVVVLQEDAVTDPLRAPGLRSLDPLRNTNDKERERRIRSLDAAVTAWPRFVFDMFDVRRARDKIQTYFNNISLDKVPEEPVALSFWAAGNLPLSGRARLALLALDAAASRLARAVRPPKSVLCCLSCGCEATRRRHMLPMSSEGLHSHYTNPGGFRHDIITVSAVSGVVCPGAAQDKFSWFPGYAWTVALCARCGSHLGWRFDATSRTLRPQRFYGLCRNYMQPRDDCDSDEEQL